MPVYDISQQTSPLAQHLARHPDATLVICYCAAWCKTCAAYRVDFEHLAEQWPNHVFVWVDIEDAPQFLGDEDIENFPTLLLQQGDSTLFHGVLQPHIQHLQRLLERADALPQATRGALPDIRQLL